MMSLDADFETLLENRTILSFLVIDLATRFEGKSSI